LFFLGDQRENPGNPVLKNAVASPKKTTKNQNPKNGGFPPGKLKKKRQKHKNRGWFITKTTLLLGSFLAVKTKKTTNFEKEKTPPQTTHNLTKQRRPWKKWKKYLPQSPRYEILFDNKKKTQWKKNLGLKKNRKKKKKKQTWGSWPPPPTRSGQNT